MLTPKRSLAALPVLTLALATLTLTPAHADTFDVSYAPTRSSTFAGAFLTHPTDIAVDPKPSATDDPSKFAVTDSASTFSHVQVLRNNPNNATGYGLANGSITDTSKSGLNGPQGVGYDSKGRIWAADSASSTVSVFSKDVTNSAPYTTIGGPRNTGLSSPSDVAVAADGTVFVANINSVSSVRVFGAGRGGDIEPSRTIYEGINNPTSIAIDSKGLIYVANLNGGAENISVYAANAESTTPPIRIITGPNTHLEGAMSLAIDSSDNLYVANPTDGGDGSITVYAPGANGDVFPVKRLSGAATGITYPTGVAVDTNRNVRVVNEYSSDASTVPSVFTFAPLIPLAKPTAVRSLKVSGTSTASTRTVSWTAPANNGGTPITIYRVMFKMGTTTI